MSTSRDTTPAFATLQQYRQSVYMGTFLADLFRAATILLLSVVFLLQENLILPSAGGAFSSINHCHRCRLCDIAYMLLMHLAVLKYEVSYRDATDHRGNNMRTFGASRMHHDCRACARRHSPSFICKPYACA